MRVFLSFLAMCFVGLVIVSGVIVYGFHQYRVDGPLLQAKQMTVEKGMGVSAIAQKLFEQNIVSSPFLFKVAVRMTDQQTALKAGEYEFSSSMSMEMVLQKIASGDIVLRQVTIPEGKTSFEIVRLLKARDDLVQNKQNTPVEGGLLPDTYAYQTTDSVQSVIDRMSVAMTKTLDEAWEKRQTGLPIKTKEEALILASIVEKETGVAGERAKVAGVFINRLKIGMPLQTDPTVIYAITKGRHKNNGKGPLGRRLLRKDLQIDSPYNTYKVSGLPPTPICNPGTEAIHATLNPEAHEYLYFVADGTGGHVFGKTLAEHNRNVAQWRKVRRNSQ